MSAQTTDGQGKDSRENARFEEQHQCEEGETGFTPDTDCQSQEEQDTDHEDKEDQSGLDEHESTSSGESTDSEQRLTNGVSVRSCSLAEVGGFLCISNELGSNTDLSTDVAELTSDTEEELVLLAKWLLLVTSQIGALLSLKSHVGICDFWDWREEEDDGKEGDEASNTDVCPLDLAEILGVLEEHSGGEQRSDDGANSLERLRQLKTELGESGRTASGDEWVGGGLEGGETASDDEEGATEATEGLIDGGRPEHESTDGVDEETKDEGPSVAELSYEPTGVCKRSDEVGPEVGTLETTSLGGCDVESSLELGVQDIEETVGETPHEEEDGDQGDREDGLSDSQS